MPIIKFIVATVICLIWIPSFADRYPVDPSIVESIRNGTYEPCDQPNAYGISDCAWGYAEIADKKIKNLEAEIVSALNGGKSAKSNKKLFFAWQLEWRKFRDRSCNVSNQLANSLIAQQSGIVPGGTPFNKGFCVRRFNEERVSELVQFLELSKPK